MWFVTILVSSDFSCITSCLRTREREERIGEEEIMRMKVSRENWCSKRMARNMLRSDKMFDIQKYVQRINIVGHQNVR